MKNILKETGILLAAGLAIIGAVAPARAQSNPMRVDIPFAFLAGEQNLPSGIYWVQLDAQFHTLSLRAINERASSRLLVRDSRVGRNPSEAFRGVLSFQKYGATLVLKGLYAAGAVERHDLRPSKAEMELVKATGVTETAETSIDLQ